MPARFSQTLDIRMGINIFKICLSVSGCTLSFFNPCHTGVVYNIFKAVKYPYLDFIISCSSP